MKIINWIFLIIVYVLFSCNSGTTNTKENKKVVLDELEVENENKGNDLIVEERKSGLFTVLIEKENVFEHTFYFISVVAGDGKKLDELKFTKMAASSTGCGSELNADYKFISDTDFIITSTEDTYNCGSDIDDPSIGVGEEAFLRIIDPYEIVDQEISMLKSVSYSINSEGKIDQKTTEIAELKNEVSGLERFDQLPKVNLKILRNFVFAKHGYKFKSKKLDSLFSSKDWYKPKFDNVDSILTSADKEIIAYIKSLEMN